MSNTGVGTGPASASPPQMHLVMRRQLTDSKETADSRTSARGGPGIRESQHCFKKSRYDVRSYSGHCGCEPVLQGEWFTSPSGKHTKQLLQSCHAASLGPNRAVTSADPQPFAPHPPPPPPPPPTRGALFSQAPKNDEAEGQKHELVHPFLHPHLRPLR
ncbi:hypothetical protein MHYP_G00028400 [Metynnis hypsauchen]